MGLPAPPCGRKHSNNIQAETVSAGQPKPGRRVWDAPSPPGSILELLSRFSQHHSGLSPLFPKSLHPPLALSPLSSPTPAPLLGKFVSPPSRFLNISSTPFLGSATPHTPLRSSPTVLLLLCFALHPPHSSTNHQYSSPLSFHLYISSIPPFISRLFIHSSNPSILTIPTPPPHCPTLPFSLLISYNPGTYHRSSAKFLRRGLQREGKHSLVQGSREG